MLGLYRDYIMLGLYGNKGKEDGKYCLGRRGSGSGVGV